MSRSTRSGPARTMRRVPAAWSYLPAPRVVDRLAGHRLDAAAVAELSRTPWAQRVTQTYLENDARLFRAAQARVAPQIRLLLTAAVELAELADERRRLVAKLEALPAVDLTMRGDAEGHLSAVGVAERRTREHDRRSGALSAQIDQVVAAERARRAQVHHARAIVAEEFDDAVCGAVRNKHFYSRRMGTFARAAAKAAGVSTVPAIELPLSTWASGPCPWLPPEPTTTTELDQQPVPAAAGRP